MLGTEGKPNPCLHGAYTGSRHHTNSHMNKWIITNWKGYGNEDSKGDK